MTEEKKLTIMFMANAPWAPTGYGVQGRHLVPGLQRAGYNVVYFAFYGLAGGTLNLNGLKILPMGNRIWGEDILAAHMKAEKADVLITLMDVWVTDYFGKMAQRDGWSWLPWTPIDQSPVPDITLERLVGSHYIVPYSLFGLRELRAAGVQHIRYVPHGYDPTTFHPGDQVKARQALHLPTDKFIVGIVAANKGYPARKCFPEQFLAFAKFHRRHPDTLLYVHSLKSPARGGLNLARLAERVGLREGEDIIFVNQYMYVTGLPAKAVAYTYQAIDLLSAASMAEGFGLPILEAQACGTPVVTTAFSSMPELTWAGRSVAQVHPFWTAHDSWAYMPEPDAITDAYEELYDTLRQPGGRESLTAQALAGALGYTWDKVINDYWLPLLSDVAEERAHGYQPN